MKTGKKGLIKLAGLISAVIFFALSLAFEPSDVIYDKCQDQQYIHADCSGFQAADAGEAKNVILLIGDGMGINQIYADRVYLNGPDIPLTWETLPHHGLVTTCSLEDVTDSAASATAMATGNKTLNGGLSMKLMPVLEKVPNISDMMQTEKAIGVVTTTMVWDATPAAFVAHVPERNQERKIAGQMILESKPEVILGGGQRAFEPMTSVITLKDIDRIDFIGKAREQGYTFLQDRPQMLAANPDSINRVLGLFAGQDMDYEIKRSNNSSEPHLTEMAQFALDVLDNDPRGFFLMVEGGRIDHACHEINLDKLLGEMTEFNKTVELVLKWAQAHPETTVFITADHETGGMEITSKNYQPRDKVELKWTTKNTPFSALHSSQEIPIFGTGPNSAAIKPHMDNTDIMCLITNAFGIGHQNGTLSYKSVLKNSK